MSTELMTPLNILQACHTCDKEGFYKMKSRWKDTIGNRGPVVNQSVLFYILLLNYRRTVTPLFLSVNIKIITCFTNSFFFCICILNDLLKVILSLPTIDYVEHHWKIVRSHQRNDAPWSNTETKSTDIHALLRRGKHWKIRPMWCSTIIGQSLKR